MMSATAVGPRKVPCFTFLDFKAIAPLSNVRMSMPGLGDYKEWAGPKPMN